MKHTECICHNCCNVKLASAGMMYGCGCETAGPVYDAEACGECPQKSGCDVPKNPELYQFTP
ncbi:hypothetical protein [Geoalkalibacter subterraneus]|uniref:Uncharacterized protein n=1 Tax=Geoalkalibacter subterraneus TaxID=483547 RepID=A0A0B5FJ54_9BACT|nr:hypothetical protein [Geoalkalibacter subterraneus]AJF08212.1 hypothetical protein GSUB_17130 [Geoalkalibacter subterraneus]